MLYSTQLAYFEKQEGKARLERSGFVLLSDARARALSLLPGSLFAPGRAFSSRRSASWGDSQPGPAARAGIDTTVRLH